LSGRRDDNPGWSYEDFDNKNNHSIVIRVDFGKASFLFTGDLEKPAIATERSRASLSQAVFDGSFAAGPSLVPQMQASIDLGT